MARKYRGKYTNARDCEHAGSTEGLIAAVEILETCPYYGKLPYNLAPVAMCQSCTQYEKREDTRRRD